MRVLFERFRAALKTKNNSDGWQIQQKNAPRDRKSIVGCRDHDQDS